jgi:hypothetical protein
MRQVQGVLVAVAALLFVNACAVRQTMAARADSDGADQPACPGGATLAVQNGLEPNVTIVERSPGDGGIATPIASVRLGSSTVTLPEPSTKKWYEARMGGTNQGVASARIGRPSDGLFMHMSVQCR